MIFYKNSMTQFLQFFLWNLEKNSDKRFIHLSTSDLIILWELVMEKDLCLTCRVLHEKDHGKGMSRNTFFFIAMICSFCYYVFPGYLFSTLSSVSWVCWIWPRSVTAQQIGSGLSGLGLGAFGFDWSTIAAFLFSPLISPFFAIMNVFAGYLLVVYFAVPLAYWGTNMYNAKTFPIFSSHLFTAQGQNYNISQIVNNKFELDLAT